MKKYLLAIVLVFVGVYLLDGHCTTSRFKEGDIIFQTSKSEQSKYIRMATKSQLSHCGIVVEKGGRQYVLEASNVKTHTGRRLHRKRGRQKVLGEKSGRQTGQDPLSAFARPAV